MSLQTTMHLNIDFYDKKYIMLNAKQYDSNSRLVTVTCYNQGELLNLSASKHTVYVRYRKADGHGVLNSCRLNYRGEVLIELTEQMLAADGICYVDLIVINKGSAIVNIDTGEIITVDDSQVLSTMAFCINVYEATIDNSLIESSYEYDALNEALQKAEADYTEVIQLSKSYAVGNAGRIRENEDTDNSKYYCELSKESADNSANSEANAKIYMDNSENYKDLSYDYSVLSQRYAVGGTGTVENEDVDNSKYYYEQALDSANNADESESASKEYAESSENSMNAALASASSASASEVSASNSAASASNSATSALESASSASKSATSALDSMNKVVNIEANVSSSVEIASNSAIAASESATSASNSASFASESAASASESESLAKEYAELSETNKNSASVSATSASESAANAHTYYLQVEEITTGLSGAFMPMGTIEFAELATIVESGEIKAGYLYNISDNFITDDSFKRGAGIEYAAGTNVYMTSSGYLDCLPSTTVFGVKGDAESEYRKGNINLTPENIGAVPSINIATVEDVKKYLGI